MFVPKGKKGLIFNSNNMYNSKNQKVAQTIKKQVRPMKIACKFQERAYFQMVKVPEIKLAGKWLTEAGFLHGQEIKVIVENQKLVIMPLEKSI